MHVPKYSILPTDPEPRAPRGDSGAQPNLAEAERWIWALTGSADTRLHWEARTDNEAAKAEWARRKAQAEAEGRRCRHPLGRLEDRRLYGSLAEVAAPLVALNTQPDRWAGGVLVRVGEFDPGGPHDASGLRAFERVLVEFDPAHLAGRSLDDILRELHAAGALPTTITETSPGRHHLLWALDQPYPPELFAPTLVRLADRLGGDRSACLPTQQTRVAGFLHHKGAPVRSRLLQPAPCDEPRRLVYRLGELQARLGLGEAHPGRHTRAGDRAPAGRQEQPSVLGDFGLPLVYHANTVAATRRAIAALPLHDTYTTRDGRRLPCGIADYTGWIHVVVHPLAAMFVHARIVRRPDLEAAAVLLLAFAFERGYGRTPHDGDPDWERALAIFKERVAATRSCTNPTTLLTLFFAARQHGWDGLSEDASDASAPCRQSAFALKVKPVLGSLRGEAALDAACAALLACDPDERRAAAKPTAWSLLRRRVPATDVLRVLGPFGIEAHHLQEIPA